MSGVQVLLVDDEEEARDLLAVWLVDKDCTVRQAGDLAEARALLEDAPPELALLDLELPDGSGLELLEDLARTDRCEVVMISGRSTVDSAVSALRLGASDYLVKPVDLRRLEVVVEGARRSARLRSQVQELRSELKRLGRLGELIGSSSAMLEVYSVLERVAPTDETVLITGQTGTGKEVTARTIHALSRRSAGPFVAVNCSAVAASLLESEFFGHEKGAFTGADKRRIGLFEQAKGGTLFLDEVTEMDIELQSKLLRVLEERKLTRVGGSELIDVDVRILAASNRDLRAEVDAGRFREDLLYRLMVFPIELPPLSQRDGDVPLLAEAVLARLNQEYEQSKRLSPEAIADLERYPWPGNVRELNNLLRRAFVLADEVLGPEHLRFEAPLDGGQAEASSPAAGEGSEALAFRVGESIAQVEQRLIEATLEAYGGDKPRASDDLGISLKTLYSRLKVYASVREAQGDS